MVEVELALKTALGKTLNGQSESVKLALSRLLPKSLIAPTAEFLPPDYFANRTTFLLNCLKSIY